ncbi:hypothetical protein NST17_19800 [Caldifermentibacillus hisashii]|uniref:Uncharacterized protein n=1 Tax=Caldifermentibacillus hisashii TaxID=996558 RepID=A0ABU9K2X4_9BACI
MSKDYIGDVFSVLISSERLKRLLWYRPENMLTETPDPLSSILPNISDDEELNWRVIEDRILRNSKTDDLVDNEKCRIYLYLGSRDRTDNMSIASQKIIIDLFWHDIFDEDNRSELVEKELRRLLVGKRITGIGKMKYYDGGLINAPKNYQGYRHVYEVGSFKK